MQVFKVQVKNGRLALDVPTDLPDGAEVEVVVIDDELTADERLAFQPIRSSRPDGSARRLAQLDTRP